MNIGTLLVTLRADTTQLMTAQAAMTGFQKSTIASINTMSQRMRTFGYLATAAFSFSIISSTLYIPSFIMPSAIFLTAL